MNLIRIIANNGGSPIGTKVLDHDGNEIPMVTKVSISPFDADSVVTAEIELLVGEIDITACPLLGLDTLHEAAAVHGYKLVPVNAVETVDLATGNVRYVSAAD